MLVLLLQFFIKNFSTVGSVDVKEEKRNERWLMCLLAFGKESISMVTEQQYLVGNSILLAGLMAPTLGAMCF